MIRYFIDFEFMGFGGELISGAVVREDGSSIYLVQPNDVLSAMRASPDSDPWVLENVMPHLYNVPRSVPITVQPKHEWGPMIAAFLYQDDQVPQIFADWMTDISDLMNLFVTGPGTGVPMNHQTHMVCLRHLDVYPTTLAGAIQHNAYWDAAALKHWLDEMETK